MTRFTYWCIVGYHIRCTFYLTIPNRLASVDKKLNFGIFSSKFTGLLCRYLRVHFDLTTAGYYAREIGQRLLNRWIKFIFFHQWQIFETIDELNLFKLYVKWQGFDFQLRVYEFHNDIAQDVLIIMRIKNQKLQQWFWNNKQNVKLFVQLSSASVLLKLSVNIQYSYLNGTIIELLTYSVPFSSILFKYSFMDRFTSSHPPISSMKRVKSSFILKQQVAKRL